MLLDCDDRPLDEIPQRFLTGFRRVPTAVGFALKRVEAVMLRGSLSDR